MLYFASNRPTALPVWISLILSILGHKTLYVCGFVCHELPQQAWHDHIVVGVRHHSNRIGRRSNCRKITSSSLNYQNLPSIEQVSNDPFTEQVYHASEILRRLKRNNNQLRATVPCEAEGEVRGSSLSNKKTKKKQSQEETLLISKLISAQLSHPDGIRGFFSIYLTGDEEDCLADLEEIPKPIAEAMKRANMEDLASLACMNVVVPTSTLSKHTDPILKQNSQKTAHRAKRILQSLKGSTNVIRNCAAIYIVAVMSSNTANTSSRMDKTDVSTTPGNDKLIAFWNDLFEASQFASQQRKDIAKTFSDLID